MSIAWIGPLGTRGGYGGVARNYVRGLVEAGVTVGVTFGPVDPDIGGREHELISSLPQGLPHDCEIAVVHNYPGGLPEVVAGVRQVWDGPVAACTIGETDRIPAAWAQACNLADEVWLPTSFNLLSFGRSGVELPRMRLVPYGMDPAGLEPEGPVARDVAPDDHFVFLYTFAFDWRKGFDLLLDAYLHEFTDEDPVTLVLKVYDPGSGPVSVRSRMISSIADRVDLFRQDLPRVVLLDEPLPRERLLALTRRADLYVSTDRANGWGMPCMEAMTLGRPAATIDWSGSTEFMREDNALLIPSQPKLVPVDPRLSAERPDYAGQAWADVLVEDVRAVLRRAFAGEIDLASLGQAAQEEILERWTVRQSAQWILDRSEAGYTPREGLIQRLRPLLGLSAEQPLESAREHVLVLGLDGGAWRPALRAFAEAFGPDDPVTLALWCRPGVLASEEQVQVIEALAELGLEEDAIGDMLLVDAAPEEALVDDRVRGFLAPAPWWPLCTAPIAAEADDLRQAVTSRMRVALA
jgi:glycosyltransferase involved in cell wall biosynthesis